MIEVSGVCVKQVASWRLDDGDATRGENFHRFNLFDAETTTRLFSVIVEAQAEVGLTLGVEARASGLTDLAETLLHTAHQSLTDRMAR